MPKVKFVCFSCKKEFLDWESNRGSKRTFCSRACCGKSKIGWSPWNKGTKGKMRAWNKGIRGLQPWHNIGGLKPGWGKGMKIPQRSGVNHWSFGKEMPQETRDKISRGLKGKLAKEKNPAWKGGTQSIDKMERVKFRKQIQKQVYERDNYTCQLCGKQGELQVDHIQPWAEYIEGRFDINNCRTLCMRCHYKITYGKDMPINIKAWGQNLFQLERMVD